MSKPTDDQRRPRGGWFAVTREVFEHAALNSAPYCERSAWLWLIAHAAHRDHDTTTARGVVIRLKRGEVIVGRNHVAKVWRWGEKEVRNFLARLERFGMLEKGQRIGQYANVKKICNYERFQASAKPDGPSKGPTSRPTKDQREANEGPHLTRETNKHIAPPLSPVAHRQDGEQGFDVGSTGESAAAPLEPGPGKRRQGARPERRGSTLAELTARAEGFGLDVAELSHRMAGQAIKSSREGYFRTLCINALIDRCLVAERIAAAAMDGKQDAAAVIYGKTLQ